MATAPLVCLIDDDALVRDALAFVLSDHGYEFIEAGDGAAGLVAATGRKADIVITDVNMPAIDGLALIRDLRARMPDVRVVAMTGAATRDGKDVMELARAAGADECLRKPFRPAELLAALARLAPPTAR